ncbi:putative transcription factor capicua [Amphibalanus amphitrite]|uniref:putative transcription factor capicua n=1 Tax=Amphibalanus amphitrite TaxID=1232801 RepID=UPI001C917B5C|nr:putative transcription factor capicua [Amphibalanus amphitrite]
MPAPERPAAGAFVLAPTPAQLGRAPLQRRLGSSGSAGEPPPATAAARRPSAGASTPAATATSGAQPTATSAAAAARRSPDHMDKVLEQVNFSEKFTRLPQFRPGEIPSPSALSPRVTPSQRRRRADESGSEVDTPGVGGTPRGTNTPLSASLHGSRFFGPDFCTDKVKELSEPGGQCSPARSPRTPGGDKSGSLRRILDQRRSLVLQLFHEQGGFYPSSQAIATFQNEHANLFPNKQMLVLKIREVRQRLMQNAAQESAPAHSVEATE